MATHNQIRGSNIMNECFDKSIAEKFSGEYCKLDGQVAIVCGRLNNWATISSIDEPSKSVEFSWPAVRVVMANGGNFKS